MSSEHLESLRSRAFALPDSDRAELARDLIRSLDSPADPDAELAWEAELLRRLKQIEGDEAELLSRDDFRKHLRDRIGDA